MADIQKYDNSDFWRGLNRGMAVASSAGLAVFGLAIVCVTGLALATGSLLVAGLVPATPLITTGLALGGGALIWGGVRTIRQAAGPVADGTVVPAAPAVDPAPFGPSLTQSFKKIFSAAPPRLAQSAFELKRKFGL